MSDLPSVANREVAAGSARLPRRLVAGLFDASAEHYDRICRVMSFGTGQTYRRDALTRAGLQPGMRLLDVATGTGLMVREAMAILGDESLVLGVDPSAGMLREARQVRYRVVRGLGEALPFQSRRFDFLCMGYALRHLDDLHETFSEYLRVLSPGGRLVLLEITPPDSRVGSWLTRQYFQHAVPLMTRVVTRNSASEHLMRYYWDTIAQFVPPADVVSSLRESGFVDVARNVVHGIFSEYVGRKRSVSDSPHH